jgi:zinc protease
VPPGPAKAFQAAPVEEASLANGLKVAVMESHRLPLVSVKLVLPLGGTALDPQGKSGLASLVAGLMTEGAGSLTGRQFAEALDDIGATIGVSADSDALTVTVFATKDHIDAAVGLAAQAIRRPALPMPEFNRLKDEAKANLEQQKGEPGAQAEKLLGQRIYGEHPYGAAPDQASLDAISLQDARTFAQQRLVPNGAVAAAGGDITLPEFQALIQKHFGSWKAAKSSLPSVPGVPVASANAPQGVTIDLIDMPGSQQSAIRAGDLALSRNDPDYMAVAVMNFLLGRAPILSRLDKNLREQHGWAYGASSVVDAMAQGGSLTISADVQTDATASAVSEILKEMKRLQDEEVPAAELAAVKRLMSGLFVQRQQTVQALSSQAASIELYGLPKDELATYRDRVAAVTAQQLQAAARKYLHPESVNVVISGDAAKVAKDLAGVGTVRVQAAVAQQPAGAGR